MPHGWPEAVLSPELVGRGTSLWLVPDDPENEVLKGLIDELALAHATPPFAAHVTLVAGLTLPADEVLARSEGLAMDLERCSLRLLPPEGREEAFRCLILPVGPTLRLLAAQALARAVMRPDEDRPYEPHLSLVYGSLAPSVKDRLIGELKARVPDRARFSSLDVVRTAGPVSQWHRLRRFVLGGPPTGPTGA